MFVYVQTEILDFGYPQNSETGALKTFITQQGIKGQVSNNAMLLGCQSKDTLSSCQLNII